MQIMKFVATVAIVLVAFSCQSQQTKSNAPAATTVSQSTSVPTGSPFTNVDVAGFKQLMGGNDVVVLDVRTPQETAMGMIEGAIQINVMDPSFQQKIASLDKDKTYLVYCRSGRRSVTACNTMADAGFSKLYNLLGGYNVWR